MALGVDIVSHYLLNSDYTDGVASNDLSLVGSGGAFVAAVLGNGFDNQNTGQLQIANMAGLETNGPDIALTIDGWINIQAGGGTSDEYIFDITPVTLGGEGDCYLIWNDVTKRFIWYLTDQSGSKYVESAVYSPTPTAQWIHLLAWFDATGEFGLAVDNSDISIAAHSGFSAGTVTTWPTALLGRYSGTSGQRIDAILDNVGIWTRALTSSERDTRYNAGNGLAYPFPTPGKPNILIW